MKNLVRTFCMVALAMALCGVTEPAQAEFFGPPVVGGGFNVSVTAFGAHSFGGPFGPGFGAFGPGFGPRRFGFGGGCWTWGMCRRRARRFYRRARFRAFSMGLGFGGFGPFGGFGGFGMGFGGFGGFGGGFGSPFLF